MCSSHHLRALIPFFEKNDLHSRKFRRLMDEVPPGFVIRFEYWDIVGVEHQLLTYYLPLSSEWQTVGDPRDHGKDDRKMYCEILTECVERWLAYLESGTASRQKNKSLKSSRELREQFTVLSDID